MAGKNFELALKTLYDNELDCSEKGQKRDVNLICRLLRLKYNCIEIESVSQLLITKVGNCLNKKESWFGNH